MIENENFSSFPCKDMLSRCFHFRVFEIFVPNLFLLSFCHFNTSVYQLLMNNQQVLKKKIMMVV